MLKFIADENFNNNFIRAIFRRNSEIDIIRVQDVGLSGFDDIAVLRFAIAENRILLTHDVNTITKFAYQMMANGENVCGIIEIVRQIPIEV